MADDGKAVWKFCSQKMFSANSILSGFPLQVMLVIDAAVTHLENLPSLEEYLTNLGKKHQAVGVKVDSFSVRHRFSSCYFCHSILPASS